MKIGVPKEIKTNENRIALVPAGAEALVGADTPCSSRRARARGAAFRTRSTRTVGAKIAPDAARRVARRRHDHEGEGADRARVAAHASRARSIFTYFHFAADEQLTQAHIDSGAICIAYETVELPSRELPLLTPMSEVAGRMAVQEGAKYLEKLYGGRGVLLGGVPGVAPAQGRDPRRRHRRDQRREDGGRAWARRSTILDLSLERLRYLSDVMPANVHARSTRTATTFSSRSRRRISSSARVLIPGAKAPRADSPRGSQDDAAGRR